MSVRSTSQRKKDVLEKLSADVDLWVASVTDGGEAYLIPLSFAWLDGRLIMATPEGSITARNLVRAGTARVALGPTRDVVIIEGRIQSEDTGSNPELAEAHARQAGFDARETDETYVLLHLEPRRIQAWRNPAELTNRDVMRGGRWLV